MKKQAWLERYFRHYREDDTSVVAATSIQLYLMEIHSLLDDFIFSRPKWFGLILDNVKDHTHRGEVAAGVLLFLLNALHHARCKEESRYWPKDEQSGTKADKAMTHLYCKTLEFLTKEFWKHEEFANIDPGNVNDAAGYIHDQYLKADYPKDLPKRYTTFWFVDTTLWEWNETKHEDWSRYAGMISAFTDNLYKVL